MKVLFLLQLPWPIHGASMVNQSIKESEFINNEIEAQYVDLSPASGLDDIGKVSMWKLMKTIGIFISSISCFFKMRPQLVYITLSPNGWGFWKDSFLLQLMKVLGANIVVHLHGKGIREEVNKSAVKKLFYTFVFRGVNVIHLSESLFYDILDVRDKGKKMFAVNNGVTAPSYEVAEEGEPKKKAENVLPVFLYLSNYVPAKGADTLVDAINLLDPKYAGSFKVRFVGKQSDFEFFKSLGRKVRPEFVSSVEISGPLYGEEKVCVFQSSNVFILPTRFKRESFPISILEAMSYGMPVLSTYEGAIPDIVEVEGSGFLFESNSPNQLRIYMERYITDPALISLHGKRSLEVFFNRFTFEKFERRLVSVLKECVC